MKDHTLKEWSIVAELFLLIHLISSGHKQNSNNIIIVVAIVNENGSCEKTVAQIYQFHLHQQTEHLSASFI